MYELFEPDEPRVGAIVGTGPSLTFEQIEQVEHLRLFGVNNAIEFGLDVHHVCNVEWLHLNWERAQYATCQKWTWDKAASIKYGINYVKGVWADGLSVDPNIIHYHHGAGVQIINIALHYGVKKMILIGYDMRFPGKVSDREYTQPRHFHPETPLTSKHYPKTGPNGELTGLIKEMETINPDDYGIEIINCTPNSAMTCFPMMSLEQAIENY